MTETYLTYDYTDEMGWRQSGSIRLTRRLTFDEAQRLVRTLDDGYYFLPLAVGVPACPNSLSESIHDHPWHNLFSFADAVNDGSYGDSDDLYTSWPQDVVSALLRPEDLVWAFEDAEKVGWDDVAYS